MRKLGMIFLSLLLIILPVVQVDAAGYSVLTRDKSNNYIENFISSLDIKKLEKRI